MCVRRTIVRGAVPVSFYKCPKSKWYAPQCGRGTAKRDYYYYRRVYMWRCVAGAL